MIEAPLKENLSADAYVATEPQVNRFCCKIGSCSFGQLFPPDGLYLLSTGYGWAASAVSGPSVMYCSVVGVSSFGCRGDLGLGTCESPRLARPNGFLVGTAPEISVLLVGAVEPGGLVVKGWFPAQPVQEPGVQMTQITNQGKPEESPRTI